MTRKPPDETNRSVATQESEPGTRERIVQAASQLMQRQGYDGTGIKQISQQARATLGSVYHFFPGGKQELALAAISRGDQEFVEELRSALYSDPDPARAVIVLTRNLAETLRTSDWVDGCPITTTALGAIGRLPDIQSAAADAFARWRGVVLDRLLESGIRESDARDLSHMVISALEGAELAAQVSRSSRPLEVAGMHLSRLISSYR